MTAKEMIWQEFSTLFAAIFGLDAAFITDGLQNDLQHLDSRTWIL
jgi:hypothetical protein